MSSSSSNPITFPTPATYNPGEVYPPTPLPPSTLSRATRKFREEPLVPVGIGATVVALVAASAALQRGNRTQFNKFLRYRVLAQGLTVVAALGGSVYYGTERKEVRRLEKEAKSQIMPATTKPIPVFAAVTTTPSNEDTKV